MTDSDLEAAKADLQVLGSAKVYWGHQSVGQNLLDGLLQLARQTGTELRVVESAPSDATAWLESAAIGTNGEPATKTRDFAARLTDASQPAPDAALMKFCYVDFEPSTDVAAVFGQYQQAVSQVRDKQPGITLIHVTAPLTTLSSGIKERAKRMLGMLPWDDASNVKRNEFNEKLRSQYGGEPVFDIARIESTRPDGTAATFAVEGKTYQALYEGYTNDGGHLNETGQLRVARAFSSTVAEALRKAAPAVPDEPGPSALAE